MTKPNFTIGIPTYNRASLLRRSIECGLSQTLPNVEILVSDNASTDGTAELLESYGNKIRYIRQTENQGSLRNFQQLVRHAEGKYFSFLQDDDLLHRDWAKRAYAAMEGNTNAVAFGAFLCMSPSTTSWHMPTLYGPQWALDWMGGTERVIDGKLIAPFSFCGASAMPPSVAFRTDLLQRGVDLWHPECDNVIECIPLAQVGAYGNVVVAPWVGAIHFLHSGQLHLRPHEFISISRHEQYRLFAETITKIMAGWSDDWKKGLKNLFLEMPLEYRIPWLPRWEGWQEPSVVVEARAILEESIKESNGGKLPSPAPRYQLREYARDAIPPFLWRWLQRMRMHGA